MVTHKPCNTEFKDTTIEKLTKLIMKYYNMKQPIYDYGLTEILRLKQDMNRQAELDNRQDTSQGHWNALEALHPSTVQHPAITFLPEKTLYEQIYMFS